MGHFVSPGGSAHTLLQPTLQPPAYPFAPLVSRGLLPFVEQPGHIVQQILGDLLLV